MSIPEGVATYSISVRLRRTTVDYAYVNVPVVGDLVKPDDQGVGRLDEASATSGRRDGHEAQVVWYREARQVEPHPSKQGPEPGESRYPG